MQKKVSITLSVAIVVILFSPMLSIASAIPPTCIFTRDLQTGVTGSDVKCLQQYLNTRGIIVSQSGAGAIGFETTRFGALTRDAVIRWQKKNDITPSVGYFGAKSRAVFSTIGGGTGCTIINCNPANTSGNLAISLGNKVNTSAVAGSGQINAGQFQFTAPATTGVTITGLNFAKVGVISDSNINNLYLADATTGQVVAQFQSLTNGVAKFSNLALHIPAGSTWTGELRMDLSSSASAGNTIGWQLTDTTTGAGIATGLPVTAASLTVTTVTNPAIATIALTANAVGSTVDAGTQSVLVSAWAANISNSKVRLNNLQFTFVGSANPADIKNLRLKVNGTIVSTLLVATPETNFQVPGGITLNTGNSNIELFADVLGSPNRTFTFSLLQPYKVNASDTQYNTGITASITTTNQTTVTINTGSITVNLASDSPTQSIPLGTSGVTILKTRVYAAGEPVKILYIDGKITEVGSSAWTSASAVTDDVSNMRIIDDAGGQVGNTISTVASGATTGLCTLASTSITCHFGTSGSPINYTVPANTARTLSFMVDIGSSGDATSLQGSFPAKTGNLQGQTSFATANQSLVTGAVLSINISPLSVARNSSFATPTYTPGSAPAKIASFVITASAAQGARISSLSFDKDLNADFNIQNMIVKIGDTQFGTTRTTIGDSASNITFSPAAPVIIERGGSITIDAYADILDTSLEATHVSVIDLTGWSASGLTSNSSISFPGEATGQTIVLSSSPTLTIAVSANTAPPKYVLMGSQDNELATFRLSSDNIEDLYLSDITFTDTITNGTTSVSSFENFNLYDSDGLIAGPVQMTMDGAATGTISFNVPNWIFVPKNGTHIVILKASVPTFSSGGARDNSHHVFSIASNDDAVAGPTNPNITATTDGAPASGNSLTVLRSKINVTASVVGATSARAKSSNDYLANLVFTDSGATQATVGSVTLRFAGSAVTGTFQTYLLNSNGAALGSSAASASCVSTGNSCSVTFQPAAVVDGGTSVTAQVKAVSSGFADTANSVDPLSISINAATDVTFYDGTTATSSLETTAMQFFPLPVADVSYP